MADLMTEVNIIAAGGSPVIVGVGIDCSKDRVHAGRGQDQFRALSAERKLRFLTCAAVHHITGQVSQGGDVTGRVDTVRAIVTLATQHNKKTGQGGTP
jgi:hypothetical protein